MASIQKRPDGRWRARSRDSSGREHAGHFTRKVDAQRWLDETTAAVLSGTYVDPHAGRPTVGQLSASWLALKRARVKPKTLAGYEGLMDRLVLPRWGIVPVAAVTGADIEAWVAEMTTRGLSASRTRQAHQVLKGVLAHATKGRHLAVSPAQGIDLPKMLTSRASVPEHGGSGSTGRCCGPARWHTAASLAIASGANIKVVQSMLGHASATMTWDPYGHLYDDDLDRVAERMHDVREEFLRTACGLSADRAAEIRSIR